MNRFTKITSASLASLVLINASPVSKTTTPDSPPASTKQSGNAVNPARKQSVIRNTSHLIDQIIEKDLAVKKLQSFAITDDSTFLRRSYINIIGRVPTYSETTQFLSSTHQDKRADLIDSLIYSPGFNSSLFNYWADSLRLNTNLDQHGLGWHVWLRNAVDNNMPYDTFVHSMLAATGHCSTNPAVGYYLRDRNMQLDNVSNSVQVFLGTQIGCAQCHDHPFEDWTQKSYYQLAAFSGNIDFRSKSARETTLNTAAYLAKKEGINADLVDQVVNNAKNKVNNQVKGKKTNKGNAKKKRRKGGKKNPNTINYKQQKQVQVKLRQYATQLRILFRRFNRNEIGLNPSKKLKLPADYKYNDAKPGEVVAPHPLFGDLKHAKPGETQLDVFANWVTSPDNPQFTKNIANRLWKRVFGYALAEPVDNWTDRTKVSHPEALALVEKLLKANHYNIRETLRVLYHTQLYQRSVSSQEIDRGTRYYFQGPILRRMTAEQLRDSLLTLERGNTDAQKNKALEIKWNSYTQNITSILSADPAVIVKLGKLAATSEKNVRKIQVKLRKLKSIIAKAKAENNQELAKNTQLKLRALYKKRNETTKKVSNTTTPEMAQLVKTAVRNNLAPRNKKPMRSSELVLPSRNGGFLQQFGASDRKTPDAANTTASIPQVLTLLNGREIFNVSSNRRGLLQKRLLKANSNSAKLDILYLSIYSRYPTDPEREKFLPFMANLRSTSTLAKAMLNSKRFLFIQ